MKKFVLIALPVVLIVLLLVSALITPHEDPGDGPNLSSRLGESTGPENPTQPGKPSEPTEPPTKPTEPPANPTERPTEPTDSPTEPDEPTLPHPDMSRLEFEDKYTVLDRPEGEEIVEVHVNGVGSERDVLAGTTIHTADGKPVFRRLNELYILESDTVVREIGIVAGQGYESMMYLLYDGEYVFTVNLELVDIQVSYRYNSSMTYETRQYYNLEGATSAGLEVSNFASKQIKCVVITEEGEIEISPVDKPDWPR